MLESILRRLEELERRLANIAREGRVTQVDAKKGVKLSIDDPEGGAPVETPWIRPVDDDGVLKGWNPRRVGQWMKVISPNGEIGAASVAIPHSHNESGGGAPSQDLAEPMLKVGQSELRLANGVLTLRGARLLIEAPVEIRGASLTHNGTNVGDTHVHGDVMPGPADTGLPH